ncbi:hypothetical protein FBULB1_6468 [Fusarium bulbicola]|nr:hypothetical protein FBULB1_6468 [Fusarium bulbicola]
MQALPRKVAVIHTPYWNESEQKLPEDELEDVFTPTIIYFPRSDRKGHISHDSTRRLKRDSQSRVHNSQDERRGQDTEANRPEQPPASAFSSPSITCNFNMTDFERLLLSDTGKEAQQSKFSYYTITQPSPDRDSRRRKKRRMDRRKMAEREIQEYEQWVFGTWENIFSGSYSYSG